MSWALVSPGISPVTRLDGVRRPVQSRPSIRLYKYRLVLLSSGLSIILCCSVYDGKVLDYNQYSLSLARANRCRPSCSPLYC